MELAEYTFPCLRFDPDILVGYEVQMRSWGYLLQRAAVLGLDLCHQLSRVPGMNICPQNITMLSILYISVYNNVRSFAIVSVMSLKMSLCPQETSQRIALLLIEMNMVLTP